MMRWVFPVWFLLAGCGTQSPPSAYKHPRDQFFAVFPMQFVDEDFYPCFRTVSGKQIRLSDLECYQFGKSRRMHGVVHLFFKTSGGFYPDIAHPPPLIPVPSRYWMNLDESAATAAKRAGCEHCYLHIDFIGRQTSVPGRHGHLGGAAHLVVIEKLLAAQPVG
jgi:hypothetical protein